MHTDTYYIYNKIYMCQKGSSYQLGMKKIHSQLVGLQPRISR